MHRAAGPVFSESLHRQYFLDHSTVSFLFASNMKYFKMQRQYFLYHQRLIFSASNMKDFNFSFE